MHYYKAVQIDTKIFLKSITNKLIRAFDLIKDWEEKNVTAGVSKYSR
jgi:hypothetical protein